MIRITGVALLLVACSTAPPRPALEPLPPPAAAGVTAPGVLAAADHARADADGYVAWKQSRAENIDRLAILTQRMNAAIARMKAHQSRGLYRAADVAEARRTLAELRAFLVTKGD